MLKKITCCMIVMMLALPPLGRAAIPPEITAKSAIVIEASTGQVLYEKNSREQRYPASTTKIATLITALENGNINDMIVVSPEASATEGSSLGLHPGESMKMLDMLYGVMLISGNDATVAIAQHIAGSVPEFAKLMTQKAHEIGAVNTHFANSSGLPDPNHYTTAYDLALITAYGYQNELFREIVDTKNKNIPSTMPGVQDRNIFNENRMLWLYEGGNGVKTGYTDAAGRCLVSGAKRNDIQLIAVVLDSERMWDDSIALLNYSFSQFSPQVLAYQGDIIKTARVQNGLQDSVKLVASQGLTVPNFASNATGITTVVDVNSNIQAPVSQGQKLGTLKAIYHDKVIATVDLVAQEDIQRRSFFGTVWGSFWSFLTFFIRNFA